MGSKLSKFKENKTSQQEVGPKQKEREIERERERDRERERERKKERFSILIIKGFLANTL